jgi:hypothetical protein
MSFLASRKRSKINDDGIPVVNDNGGQDAKAMTGKRQSNSHREQQRDVTGGIQHEARYGSEVDVNAAVAGRGPRRAAGPGQQATQVLARFQGALTALVECGAKHYGNAGSVEILHRELARLDAFITEASVAFDTEEAWADDGAENAAAWITTRCKVPKKAAHRRVNLGRAMQEMPRCQEAWREGRISSEQAQAIAMARADGNEEALASDEATLVDQAAEMGFEAFRRSLSYWRHAVNPAGAEAEDEARQQARAVTLDQDQNGMWFGRLYLDPISGAIVSGELERIEREFFDADCAEAHERLGRTPRLDELSRTPAQRRADALVEMATRSRSAPADGIRPAPLFSVLVGYETMHGRICELENGIVLTPTSLLPWMESAYFERAVFALGKRVDVSVRARLFSGGTRRAIELRDRTCTHPYCNEPVDRCQADHIEPYALGGETTQDNGRLLCGFHNRLRNQRPPPDAPAA